MQLNNPNMMGQGFIPPAEQKVTTMADMPVIEPIGSEKLLELTQILQEYKAGKSSLDARVIASENWWKLRNESEEISSTALMKKNFTAKSGWLHNVIVQKHADAMEAYPEPNILPREEGDKGEAKMLSAIVPCVLEQNHFEQTYSDAMWRKLKGGTAIYKVVWDKNKLYGLGDIAVESISVLNVFWEPGITDIQKSKYLFQTELWDKDTLQERYPDKLKDGVKGDAFIASRFAYDDNVKTENKATVIEVYYHKMVNGRNTLQYIKYVGDVVLYATENDLEPMIDAKTGTVKPSFAETGLYDHCLYPFVFDALYPVEGSPCGYGYVDVCQNPQTEIDLLKTCFIRNARAGALPRYFSRLDGNVNEEEFLDLEKSLIKVAGNVDEATIRRVEHNPIDGSYMNLLQWDVNELKETSGNTDASQGTAPSGVTAASAIAALQEASGKGSKDATRNAYRAYSKIIELCVELIRQFYDLPRKFRVLGQFGMERYVSYSNAGIKPQPQLQSFGMENMMRTPTFDIKVSAQRANVYTKVAQNELAIQFFQLGFCNPQMSDQALMCLDMMDFDGKDDIMQKISQNGMMFDKLQQYMQLALLLSQQAAPQYTEQIAMDIQATTGMAPKVATAPVELTESDNLAGLKKEEHAVVEKARAKSNSASQPEGG